MSVRVLTALVPHVEASVIERLEGAPGIELARRCADLADLRAAAAAALGDAALVSAALRGCDRGVIGELRRAGLRVVGLAADEAGERRLRQLGVSAVVWENAGTEELGQALAPADDESDASWIDAAGLDPALASARLGPDETDETSADGAEPHGAGSHGAGSRDAGSRGAGSRDDWPVDEAAAAPFASRGRLIAVWGPTGAPGRTTIAINVAAALAEAGSRVVLVDADTWGASVGQALSLLDEAPGVAAAARASEQGTLDLPALARLAPQVSPRLRVLTGLPRADRWPELRADAIEHVLDLTRSLADHVVVDCGFSIEDDEELSYDTSAPRRNVTTLAALAQASELVAVGSGDPVGLQRLVRAVQSVATIPSPRPHVVVTKVRAAAVGSDPHARIAEALLRFAGIEQVQFVGWDPDTLDAAMLAGRSVLEHAPGSALAAELRAVAAVVAPDTVTAPSRTGRRGLLRRR
ncbi:AAA family ATPase [Janibacter sp. G1551]|uniref:AAA family ATPase n=1 Tax=Janibacter sp. G1551 TaxID=3420440 RepID=UPI003D002BF2